MTRRSRREIASEVASLEAAHTARVPESVGVIDQWLSPEYENPEMEKLGVAWRRELQSTVGCES